MPHLGTLSERLRFGLQVGGLQNQIGALTTRAGTGQALAAGGGAAPRRNLISTSDLEILRRRRRRRRGGLLPQLQIPSLLQRAGQPQITPSRRILT